MSKVKNEGFSLGNLDDILDDKTPPALEGGLPAGLEKPDAGTNNKTTPPKTEELDEEEEDDTEDPPVDDDEEDAEDGDDDGEDVDDYALPIAEEVFKELGFDFEFNAKDFAEEFGTGATGIKNFIKEIINQNSKPTFENETAEKYYKFLAEGGNPEDLSSLLSSKTSFSAIKTEDLVDDEDLQKKVYSEYLKITNPAKDKEWINKKIQRAETTGTLEDEAGDALDSVVEHYKSQETAILEKNSKAEAAKKAEIEAFWKTEAEEIGKADKIADVKVNKAVKDKFVEYYKSGKFSQDIQDPKLLRELAFISFLGKEAYTKAVTSKNASDLDRKLSRFTSSNATSNPRLPRENKKVDDIRDLDID